MEKDSLIDVIKCYLKDKGYTGREAKRVIDNFELGMKGAKGTNGEEEPTRKVKPRHGTTCLGIITGDEKKTVVEF